MGDLLPGKAGVVLGKCSSRHRHGRKGATKGAAERHAPSPPIRQLPKQYKQEKGMSARQQVKACRAFFALVSHLHSPSQCYTMTSGKRTAEPAQAAAYLAHSSTLNARHSPSTPDISPRSRKPKSKKKREARYEQEMQYNLSYDFRGASSRRRAEPSGMQDETGLLPLRARLLLSCDPVGRFPAPTHVRDGDCCVDARIRELCPPEWPSPPWPRLARGHCRFPSPAQWPLSSSHIG